MSFPKRHIPGLPHMEAFSFQGSRSNAARSQIIFSALATLFELICEPTLIADNDEVVYESSKPTSIRAPQKCAMARWTRFHCFSIALLIYFCSGQTCPDSSITYNGRPWARIPPLPRGILNTNAHFFDQSKESIVVPPCNRTACGDPFAKCIPLTPPRLLQSRDLVRRQPQEWGTARHLRDEGSQPNTSSHGSVSHWRLIALVKIFSADMWRESTPTTFVSSPKEATSCRSDVATL